MTANTTLNASTPSDSDGLIFLQCTLCGEYFELTPKNLESEPQLHVWCPKCGLTPNGLLTDEVVELAVKIVNNHVSDLLNDFGRNLSRSSENGSVKFKSGSRVKKDPIGPTISKLDNLGLQTYGCCHEGAKISPNLKMEGGYCPFYGETQNGN